MTAVSHPIGQLSADWGSAPLLAIGDSPAAIARASQTAKAAGLRLAGAVPVVEATQRLDQQLNNGAVWMELESEPTPHLDGLLTRLEADASRGLYPVVVVITRDLIDLVFAQLSAPSIQILVEPDAV
jgi:hypothetical protein